MKKIIFMVAIIATATASITNINAQQGFQIGIEGNPQLSWLMNQDDKDNNNFEYVTTFNSAFGISLQYGFDENLGIGVNGLYSFQGQQFKLSGVERIKKLEYIKIPVMLIYNYTMTEDALFIAKIGPQLGLLTNAKLTDKDGNEIIADHKKAYEDFDIGAVLSAGVGFKLMESLMLDGSLRFDYGLTNAEDPDYKTNVNEVNGGNIPSDRATTYNSTLGINVGLRYLFM